MDPGAVVRRYWEDLWGGNDLRVVDELFADPYVRHNRNGTDKRTRAELKDDFKRYWVSFGSAAEIRIDEMVVSGDRVWSRVTVRSRGEEGEPRIVTFLHEARISDDRLAESWSLAAPDVDWMR